MSNGKPHDLIEGTEDKGRSFCAYAKWCDTRNKFVTYKISPLATAMIERIQKRDPTVRIMNNQPTLEVYKAVALSRGETA